MAMMRVKKIDPVRWMNALLGSAQTKGAETYVSAPESKSSSSRRIAESSSLMVFDSNQFGYLMKACGE
jgi:hypothetical protein